LQLPFEIWASPEPTVARLDAFTYRDQLAETGHDRRASDIDLLGSLGVAAARYPVLWEKTAPIEPTIADFSWARPRLERLAELGVDPIVTLLHHGSGPPRTSLLDPEFPELLAAYAGTVAKAFPWIRRWTPINEPLTTVRFSTLYGVWYPNLHEDDAAFGHALVHEALGMLLAMDAIRAHVPNAEFVITEDLQSFTARDPSVADFVEHKRRRSYLSIELVMGRVRPGHELYEYLVDVCGVAPATLDRIAVRAWPPDLVGWNYYPNSERALSRADDGTVLNEPARLYAPISPFPLLRAAHERLGLPFGLSEVHVDGDERARVSWLNARCADLTALAAQGLPVRMLGVWAAFGMVDWASLLTARAGHVEDGIFTFAGPDGVPQETAVSRAVRELAARALPRERGYGVLPASRGSAPAGTSTETRAVTAVESSARFA
jgi:dTDP-4-dehydrorhamnose reductase